VHIGPTGGLNDGGESRRFPGCLSRGLHCLVDRRKVSKDNLIICQRAELAGTAAMVLNILAIESSQIQARADVPYPMNFGFVVIEFSMLVNCIQSKACCQPIPNKIPAKRNDKRHQ
jgi:hypothetical protein